MRNLRVLDVGCRFYAYVALISVYLYTISNIKLQIQKIINCPLKIQVDDQGS